MIPVDDKTEAARAMAMATGAINNLCAAVPNGYNVAPYCPSPNPFPFKAEDSVQTKVASIYGSPIFCDAEIFAGEHLTRIPVNRLIVEAGSKLLKDLFDRNPYHSKSIQVADVDIESFRVMLRHMYGDVGFPVNNIVEVIELAHRFGVRDCLDQCLTMLQGKTIYGLPALRLLETALNLNNKFVIQKSLACIARHAWVFFELNEFLLAPPNLVEAVVQEDSLELMNELQVFRAIMRWGATRVQLYFDKNMMTFGDIVKPLLKYVRFPLMSVMDFIENVVPTKILSAEDTSQVLETLRAIKAERLRNPCGPSRLDRLNFSRFSCRSRRYYGPDCPLELDSETIGISSSLCSYGVPKTPDATLHPQPLPTMIVSFNMDDPLEGKFYFRVERISELTVGTRVYSPIMQIGIAPWQIIMEKKLEVDLGKVMDSEFNGEPREYLAVYLTCLHPSNTQMEWSFPMDGVFKLRPQHSTLTSRNYYKHVRFVFRPKALTTGFSRFVTFKELQNPEHGFVVNDAILFEADVQIGAALLKAENV